MLIFDAVIGKVVESEQEPLRELPEQTKQRISKSIKKLYQENRYEMLKDNKPMFSKIGESVRKYRQQKGFVPHNEETKRKISEAIREAHRKKKYDAMFSERKQNNRPVKNHDNVSCVNFEKKVRLKFDTAKDCATFLGCNRDAVDKAINQKKKWKGWEITRFRETNQSC